LSHFEQELFLLFLFLPKYMK